MEIVLHSPSNLISSSVHTHKCAWHENMKQKYNWCSVSIHVFSRDIRVCQSALVVQM